MSVSAARLELQNLRDYLRNSLALDRQAAAEYELLEHDRTSLREFAREIAVRLCVKADRKERQADAIDVALGYLPKLEIA